jgi:hypothetical protein
MKIGLDYDETFTEDPVLWQHFVADAKARGHLIKFVTYRDNRYDNEDILTDAEYLDIDIVFAGGVQKEHLCPEIDVWIDDSPETIVSSTKLGNQYDGCLIQDDMEENYGSVKVSK